LQQIQPLRAGSRPFPDQRINPQVAQTLAMEAPGSSQWMDRVEPELEAAVLNRHASRAAPAVG
jgi:hypothetical protein